MPFEIVDSGPPASAAAHDPLATFERLARRMLVPAGKEIFAQESEATRYYRVARGVVRCPHLWADGSRQVSEFYFPGDLFGLEIGPRHQQAAEALTDCEILAVRRNATTSHAERTQLERLVWEATSQQLARARERLLVLARHTAYERVAFFLTEIASRSEGPWAMLPMCRQDIADYLGLTIETVSRMMTQLQQDGLVALDGSRRFMLIRRARQSANLAA